MIDPRFKQNRDSLRIATREAPGQEKFFSLVCRSLERLSNATTILNMRIELQLVENGTLYFPQICLAFLKQNVIFEVIFNTMTQHLNRSEPHQGLLGLIYSIFINVLQCRQVYANKSAQMDWNSLILHTVKIWKNYAKSNRNLCLKFIRVLRLVFEYPKTIRVRNYYFYFCFQVH